MQWLVRRSGDAQLVHLPRALGVVRQGGLGLLEGLGRALRHRPQHAAERLGQQRWADGYVARARDEVGGWLKSDGVRFSRSSTGTSSQRRFLDGELIEQRRAVIAKAVPGSAMVVL
jgi:hypothetical protein